MDYEKKYNEALKRAKELLLGNEHSNTIRSYFEHIFHELRESEDERMVRKIESFLSAYGADYFSNDEWREIEVWLEKKKESLHISESCKENPDSFTDDDERIRKWIIEELEITRDAMSGKNDYSDDPDIVARLKRLDEAIYWLEKQKENPKTAISISEDCASNARCPYKIHGDEDFIGDIKDTPAYHFGFDEGVRSEREKQKEQKQTDLPAGFYYIDLDGNKYYSKEFRYGDMKVKVGEQKPNIEICPHSIKSKSYKENGYPIENCDYGLEIALAILEKTLGEVQGYQTDDGLREHQTAIKAVKDAMKEQKPAWSEEDEKIVGFLEWMVKNHTWMGGVSRESAMRFLKDIRPVKQELSEKDRKVLDDVSHILAGLNYKQVSQDYKQAVENLLSLRPQWKPSEEQMEALKETLETYKGFEEYDAMKSLYNDLKKL